MQKEYLFFNSFQTIPIKTALINRHGQFVQVNPAFCSYLGYSEEELLRMKFQEIVSQDDLEQGSSFNEKFFQGLIPSNKMELVYIHKQGHKLASELNVSVHFFEQEPFTIVQVIDITEMKRLKEELDRFKLLYNCVNEGIALFDTDGKIIQVNRAFEHIFGWKEHEIIGKRLPVTPSFTQEDAEFLVTETLKGKSTNSFETIKQHKNGDLFPVSISMTPIRDKSDKVTGLAGIVRNITKQKISNELLLQSEKLATAGQMAAGIAHEIRNPITAISGFLQLMLDRGEMNASYLQVMKEETERINLIVNELLFLAKPQPQKQELVDFNVLLEQVIAVMEPQSNMSNIAIVKKFDENPICLECDPNQLKQVFINIMRNSIEAMPQGGELIIELSRKSIEYVRVRVKDTGVGMPKELLDKLGQPFHTTKQSGTGLGFMISKSIINQHGGTIQVNSEEHKGTTTEVTLKCTVDSLVQIS